MKTTSDLTEFPLNDQRIAATIFSLEKKTFVTVNNKISFSRFKVQPGFFLDELIKNLQII
jgi:hypothetical protein